MALVLLLCDLRDGAETRERRGGGEVSRRRAPRLPLIACAIRAVRARASCHEQVGVIWCNWIVVNALITTPGVRRVARRLRHDRKNARVPGRLPVPAVTLRVVCEPVRVLFEVGLWLPNCLCLSMASWIGKQGPRGSGPVSSGLLSGLSVSVPLWAVRWVM
jgi:hypothetical protein